MVQLNGGKAIGEDDKQFIEKCIGIDEKPSPPKISKQEETKLKKLESEQREIEAKLKFIDGLINQQSGFGGSGNNPQNKYFGGGILKRQRTDEFVLSLEQYQRAITDLQMMMEALNGQTATQAYALLN